MPVRALAEQIIKWIINWNVNLKDAEKGLKWKSFPSFLLLPQGCAFGRDCKNIKDKTSSISRFVCEWNKFISCHWLVGRSGILFLSGDERKRSKRCFSRERRSLNCFCLFVITQMATSAHRSYVLPARWMLEKAGSERKVMHRET